MATHRRRRRRRVPRIVPFLLLAICGVLFFRWSNRSLQIEAFTYASPRLPEGFDGCTIVQLSDLHGASFGEDNAELIAAVAAQDPDLIFLTGDIQDRYRKTPASYTAAIGRAMAGIAPTDFVTGNHEWAFPDVRELKRSLKDAGVTVLTNEFVALERDGGVIFLAGIDDPNGFADQKSPEALAEEVKAAADGGFWMLLAHRNNYFEKQYSGLGADLVISGHGHGGLIRLPFTDGLVSTDRTFFPSYTAGLYQKNGSTLFVTRGLGNSGRTFRLFNRPQIAVLTLRTA